ncbi:hypothetical protein BC835DRAFT_1412122 [Cytidiella melzeri]|nr:hypothetical protein BC835DRAFT_1412122 [Cytidiella melzeri]
MHFFAAVSTILVFTAAYAAALPVELSERTNEVRGDPDWKRGDPDWKRGDPDWKRGDPDWRRGDPDWRRGDPDWRRARRIKQVHIALPFNKQARTATIDLSSGEFWTHPGKNHLRDDMGIVYKDRLQLLSTHSWH